MDITRQMILDGNYVYPKDLVSLRPTQHLVQRLKERAEGLECIPTIVRITDKNIYKAQSRDGKHLHTVVIRMAYTSRRFLFLCYNPYDGTLKSLWFRDRNESRIYRQENNQHPGPPV